MVKHSRATSQTLEASVNMLIIKVHLLSNRNMAVQLRFAKLYLDETQDDVLTILVESRVEMFGNNVQSHTWPKTSTTQ